MSFVEVKEEVPLMNSNAAEIMLYSQNNHGWSRL